MASRKPKTYVDKIGRVCTVCNKYKEWGEFGNVKNGLNGKKSYCKNCDSKKVVEWQKLNPDKVKEKYKRQKEKNPGKVKENNYNQRKKYPSISYDQMMGRCYDPNHESYKNYGAKGVYVVKEWHGKRGRRIFYVWAKSKGWKPGFHLHRINPAKPYGPVNCVFLPAGMHKKIHSEARKVVI